MKAILMAAGKGTRLQDKDNPSPKVLSLANGRPLLSYVFDMIPDIDISEITVVPGFMAEKVEEAFADTGCRFSKQGDEAYGTGYAVMCGLKDSQFDDFDGDIVILNGDAPLTKIETVKGMCAQHVANGNACTLLSCDTELKLPYGRIIRNENGNIIDIKEEKDCNEEEKLISELNVGAYVFNCKALREGLSKIDNNNKANEYYITSVPPALAAMGYKVESFITTDNDELWGVNTPEDLEAVEKILKSRQG